MSVCRNWKLPMQCYPWITNSGLYSGWNSNSILFFLKHKIGVNTVHLSRYSDSARKLLYSDQHWGDRTAHCGTHVLCRHCREVNVIIITIIIYYLLLSIIIIIIINNICTKSTPTDPLFSFPGNSSAIRLPTVLHFALSKKKTSLFFRCAMRQDNPPMYVTNT